MIRYLSNEEIDASKWDACIRESMPSLIYAYSWYLDGVCDDWGALVEGDYETVMPIPFTQRFFIPLAIQAPFCQQLGVFSKGTISKELIHRFLHAIPSKFRWVKLNLNYLNRLENELPLKANFVLDLIPAYETLQSNYASDLIRGIRSSEKSSCSLLEGIDMASILDLVAWQNSEKKMGISKNAMARLQRVINQTIQNGALTSVGMYSPMNHLCAVGLFLRDRNRLYYLLGASDETGRDYRGMARIMDYMIRKHAGQDLTLDFEGSEIPGVANFFKKFGGHNSPYSIFTRRGMGIFNSLMAKRLG